jgi:hypothetical protein
MLSLRGVLFASVLVRVNDLHRAIGQDGTDEGRDQVDPQMPELT